MCLVLCYECSARQNTYIRHDWPPCDLNQDGTAKEPQPCGHRRPFVRADGTCSECRRLLRE